MEYRQFLDILMQAGKLKITPRHCFTEGDRYESVADHSWRISLMAMLLSHEEEFRDLDMNRVIRMCLIHDLGESFTGDIPTFLKKSSDEEGEEDILRNWINTFDDETRKEWLDLLDEMNTQKTLESRVYKSLDKLEALISHNESDIRTWLPLEYDLQLTYGQDQISFSPYLKGLRVLIDDWTKEKIEKEKPE
ncbi:MAG: HD domain-containing protein [Erysipelotrichaceae bacterium]|nr:HD domain-containing protein [Erysipelotrichaceae bacterium]MBQ1757740.1 HD domain-containing protein [Erysipelotrichaceae bacterium]